jgi:hypothetical protein
MTTVTPPIVLVDGLDVQFFSSIEAAEGWMEAIDVENGVYHAYDSRGRALVVETKGERVYMAAASEEPPQAHELERLLRDYLRHHLRDIADDPDNTLPRLLDACISLSGLTG